MTDSGQKPRPEDPYHYNLLQVLFRHPLAFEQASEQLRHLLFLVKMHLPVLFYLFFEGLIDKSDAKCLP